MNEWLVSKLVCPRDRGALERSKGELVCALGHSYPIFDDIPVMLIDDTEVTHDYINRTFEKIAAQDEQGSAVKSPSISVDLNAVDEFVQGEVPYTSGNLYFSVQHKLTRYPIPETRLRPGNGERLLDIGCNWGRWSIAASKKGYRPVGLDPSLDAVLAAKRVARQLSAEIDFVVGDARFLPFADSSFDTVFSYGVFQHFSKENARISIDEVVRVCKANGTTLVQMPNKYGIRQYQQHRRRGFSEGEGFEVRYWTPAELTELFEKKIGPTEMTVDCYFGLGIQASDVDLLPIHFKAVVYSSEFLRKLSRIVKPLTKIADSVYLESINRKKS